MKQHYQRLVSFLITITKYNRSALIFLFVLCLQIAATAQRKSASSKRADSSSVLSSRTAKPAVRYKIYPAEQNTFGYDILSQNRALIHQPSIPGVPGNKGFNKKEDAEKCARLVIQKLTRNIMPPTVTIQEMDSLKIKF